MEKFNITDNDWYFDGDALIEWVSKCTNNEKNIETVITNVYPMEADENNNVESLGGLVPIMETPRKEITETKNSKNELFSTTRINFIFSMINALMTPYEEGDETQYNLAANTLIHLGILKRLP